MIPALSPSRPDAPTLLERHRAALARSQPGFANTLPPDLSADALPLPGRDGSPTFRIADAWWTGCSVPRAAARAMLDTFSPTSQVSCFLYPFHPAAVGEVLSRLAPNQAVIVLFDASMDLSLFLGCDDFTADIEAHRLFFARDTVELEFLLTSLPGLPLPGLFIRTPGTDDSLIQDGIEQCQKVFNAVRDRWAERTRLLSSSEAPPNLPPTPRSAKATRRLLVTAARGFKLWENTPATLVRIAADIPGAEVVPWWIDDPTCLSPLHLLEQSRVCDAMLTADFFRADGQGIIPASVPVLTWVTQPRVERYTDACRSDRLLLADVTFKREARKAGWSDSQIELASRPFPASPLPPPAAPPHLALIADTRPIEIPPEIEDYSSHRLLWERVESELQTDPLRLGIDIAGYLERTRLDMHIAAEGFPIGRIAEALVLPLWQQQVARRIVEAGLPLRIHGRGWEATPLITEHPHLHMGKICTPGELENAVQLATGLVVPLPLEHAHPVEFVGRPALRPSGDWGLFFKRLSQLLTHPPKPSAQTIPPISVSLLQRLF